jgi:hypothetical protein
LNFSDLFLLFFNFSLRGLGPFSDGVDFAFDLPRRETSVGAISMRTAAATTCTARGHGKYNQDHESPEEVGNPLHLAL